MLALLPLCHLECSFGGQVLWPGREPPAADPCGRCGGPRVFEVQLMSPAITYLEETADWLAAEQQTQEQQERQQQQLEEEGSGSGGSWPRLLRPPASWGWLTIAVLCCRTSCPPGSSGSSGSSRGGYVEEQVVLCSE